MTEFLRSLASSDGLMPHGMCYLWEPGLVWLHLVSDALTGLAYLAIPPALFVLVWKAREEIPEDAPYGRRRLPHDWIFLAFGVFIVACGLTHLVAVWTIWDPRYWVSGGVKAVTAVASVATAVALPPLVPRALQLIRDARDSEVRRTRLEEANRELEELYGKLQASDRLKSELMANVSHELRTPLTLILGPAEELLARPDLDRDIGENLAVMRRNARALLGQVDDLLDAARLELDQASPEFEDVDLAALVAETTRHFEPLARAGEIELSVRAPEELVVRADPEMTERILLNLLSNAFKFTPAGGVIRVAVETRGPNQVALEVRDSGEGIPESQRATIFERFRQADGGSTRTHGGTGLGLSIAREFARAQGGELDAGDAPEGGALFRLRLPRRRPLADGPDRRWSGSGRAVLERARLESRRFPATRVVEGSEAVAGSGEAKGNGAEGPRILLVEDDLELREFLGSVLAGRYRVEAVANGVEGLRSLENEVPDLIVTDIMMPDMDGEKLLGEIRDRSFLDHVPVLILTARAEADLVARLLRSGAQDYLLKPVGPEELRARIDNHLEVSRSRKILQGQLRSREDRLEVLAGQAAEQKERLEAMVQEKSMLVQELHHRVKGNLQTITSLLNLQVRRVEDPSAREALLKSRGRIAAMALLHERLYRTDDPTRTPMDTYLESLLRDVLRSWEGGPGRIGTEVRAQEISVDAERAVKCGLIVHELVSNALRHGYAPEESGTVVVGLERGPRGEGPEARKGEELVLTVEDDGAGLPPGFDPESTGSLGLSLVQALTRQLGGTAQVESNGGVRWRIRFPCRVHDLQEGME